MIVVIIIYLLILLVLGQYVIKTAIDTSKNSQHTREILEELKEIKALLKETVKTTQHSNSEGHPSKDGPFQIFGVTGSGETTIPPSQSDATVQGR